MLRLWRYKFDIIIILIIIVIIIINLDSKIIIMVKPNWNTPDWVHIDDQDLVASWGTLDTTMWELKLSIDDALTNREEIDYKWRLADFKSKMVLSWVSLSESFERITISVENNELTIFEDRNPIGIIPYTENENLRWMSWLAVEDKLWSNHNALLWVVTSTDFWQIHHWIDSVWIKSMKYKWMFYREVLGLENGYYVCADSQKDNKYCHAFKITDFWAEFVAMDKLWWSNQFRYLIS